ncbi:MAG: hypothetical protein R3C27_01760 [Hyphomonadaceae bacterium]
MQNPEEEPADGGQETAKPKRGLFALVAGIIRTLGGLAGLGGGLALTFFKLEELAIEKGWRFSLSGWQEDVGQVWRRSVAQIGADQWPSVWVILTEGLVAALAISIVFSYTVNNISQRISTIWQYMRPVTLPSDVVRADAETRDWVNGLSAEESRTQKAEIARLKAENTALQSRNSVLSQENTTLRSAYQAVVEQLRANERVFTKFENFAAAFQKRIANLRRKAQPFMTN